MKKMYNTLRTSRAALMALLVGLLMLAAQAGYAQTTIWEEPFTYSNGTVTATKDGVTWTATNGVQVKGNRLEAATNNSTIDGSWSTTSIPISGYTSVTISIYTGAIGSLEVEDGITFEYQVDLNSPIVYEAFNDNFDALTLLEEGINGSELFLTVYFLQTRPAGDNGNEGYWIDDVVITGYTCTAPTITCPTGTFTANANANCQALVPDYTTGATVTDGCGNVTVTQSPAAGSLVGLGDNTVTLTATDENEDFDDCILTFTVTDGSDPVITCPTEVAASYDNDEGECSAELTFSASAVDNCDNGVTIAYYTGVDDEQQSITFPYVFEVGTTTVKAIATDDAGNTDECTFDVTVSNTLPNITDITPSAALIPINTTISLDFDPNDNNIVSTTIDWGDGTTDSESSHTYTKTGVYRITVNVEDACDATDEEMYEFIVVYDPSAGFVTGGGWINSPAGAYAADLYLTGKATFGFVSKYEKGKSVPSGNTEFQFHAAGMNFKSTAYDWLVVSGTKAQYKGTGTIAGETGSYGFMLTATDGTPDLFRIKIWVIDGAVVYDNQMDAADDAEPTTAIANGSIVVHQPPAGKTKSAEIATAIAPVVEYANLKVYPNPFSDRLRFEFVSPESVNARIDLYDMTGRLVKNIFEQPIEGGVSYNAEFIPEAIISGMYIYRVTMGEAKYNGKVTFKK